MKVLLIAPPIMDYLGRQGSRLIPIAMDSTRECTPLGIYMLASILRQHGHEVVVADLVALGVASIRLYRIEVEQCDLIGLGATSLAWPTASCIIRQIRRIRKHVPVVLGGIHATMFDRYLLRTSAVQYVVRGEAEIALPALCRALETGNDVSSVPNLSWRDADGKVVRNPLGKRIPATDLGNFPLPAYDMIPTGIYKGLSVESSRGCAFDCSFCSTSYRRAWRALPAETFVNRLEAVMQHLNKALLPHVHIIDDEFSLNPRRATEIANIIRRRGLHPQLIYDSRATDLLSGNYVESIAEFTHQFLVGAECGYDDGLKRIGKGTTCEILEKAANKLYAHGISNRADFSFIVGLPWETKTEIEKTIQFAVHLSVTYGVRSLLQWYCQIPGSRLWEDSRRNSIVSEAMYDDFGFFRNLYLFVTGVRVTPDDVWELGELMWLVKSLSRIHSPDRTLIEFGFPVPVYQYFSQETAKVGDTGLASLREVSHPERTIESVPHVNRASLPVEVGIPLRQLH